MTGMACDFRAERYPDQIFILKMTINHLKERYKPMKPEKDTMTRRRFLKTSTQITALAGLSVATQAYGSDNDRIRVGLVGCGGRGF